jgi:hypothetical protein
MRPRQANETAVFPSGDDADIVNRGRIYGYMDIREADKKRFTDGKSLISFSEIGERVAQWHHHKSGENILIAEGSVYASHFSE